MSVVSRIVRASWWLIYELLAVALVGVGLLLPAKTSLADQLAGRVEGILEQITPAEHHEHGHEVAAADKVICTAETFGYEPANAATVAQVQVVYAYYLCAAGTPGTEWDFSARISGPVSVTLSVPPRVRIAEAGSGYPERVRAMIPDNLEPKAFSGFSDPARPSALRARYDDEVAS